MEKDNITKTVNNFKTKHKAGFTDREIKLLLKQFITVSYEKFNNALGPVTCMVIHDETIIYHHDVESAIRCCVEKHDSKLEEWD